MGKQWKTVADFIFLGSKITVYGDWGHEIKRRLLLERKVMTNLGTRLKSRDITLPTKVRLVKGMVFPVVMYGYELDYKESWAPKNWCFWTVVLEKTLESPLHSKEIQPVHPKGDQSWVFTGRTDVEAETPILWPPDAKSWLIWKVLMLGKIEGRRRRGQQRMRCLMASLTRWRWVWVNSGSWWWTGRPGMLRFMGVAKSPTQLSNWTEPNWRQLLITRHYSCHLLSFKKCLSKNKKKKIKNKKK